MPACASSSASCVGRPGEPPRLVLGRDLEQPLAERLQVGPGAAAAPHQRALRPLRKSRRATTSVSSPSGRRPATAASSGSSSSPSGSSNSASTYASSACGPTSAGPGWPPASRPIAWASIVLPAPVSPVNTFSPGDELQLGPLDQRQVLDRRAAAASCARRSPGSGLKNDVPGQPRQRRDRVAHAAPDRPPGAISRRPRGRRR